MRSLKEARCSVFPLTEDLLAIIKCDSGQHCKRGQCPICTQRLGDMLNSLKWSPSVTEQIWHRSTFALRSMTCPKGSSAPVPLKRIITDINEVIDALQRSSRPGYGCGNFGCVATFALVEDTSSSRTKVTVIEVAVTGVPPEDDAAILEKLSERFGEVSKVPTAEDDGTHPFPSQELLFGFTKRRLDRLERPMAVSNKIRLAEIAANYGSHSVTDRLITRGLDDGADFVTFGESSLPLLWWL